MSEMTPLFERRRVHLDPNRPPMTKAECLNVANAKGALYRALNTLKRQSEVLAKYKDNSDKPSDSGMLIGASLKSIGLAEYWLEQGVGVLESALAYAKEGK